MEMRLDIEVGELTINTAEKQSNRWGEHDPRP